MTKEIVLSEDVLLSFQDEFGSLKIPYYKFRSFFSVDEQIFFDCDDGDTVRCLNAILGRKDYDYFDVFLLVKDKKSGKLLVMDVRYANIGEGTLEHFIKRYNSQLKITGIMSLEASGKELVRHLGYSYED